MPPYLSTKHGSNELDMFIAEFIRNPKSVGALSESSPDLAEMMTGPIDWKKTERVIELGSGSGSFTSLIVRRKTIACRLVAFETNPKFARRSAGIAAAAGESSYVINGPFEEHYGASLSFLGGKADVVISGLPWAFFDDAYQDHLLTILSEVLSAQGQFFTFGYVPGLLLRSGRQIPKKLRQVFSRVDKSPVVWRNLPPAFVYRCSGPMGRSGSRL